MTRDEMPNRLVLPQAEQRPTPYEILRSMLVPERGSVFVLGCFERRVTLLHQQVRALNLVFALRQLGYCGTGTEVAIVGAGAAGLTAAAALGLIEGCRVTLLEREDRELPVLDRRERTAQRHLDPVLYEWPGTKPPGETFDRTHGGTPLTGWPRGPQPRIVEWIRTEWGKLKGVVEFLPSAHDIRLSVQDRTRKPILSWRKDGVYRTKAFDVVVLALGFGAEKTMPPLQASPYWERDDLEAGAWGACLVSGSGDGGWTDLFRLAIPGFRQDTMEHEFLSGSLVSRRIRRQLGEIEERALRDQIVGRDPDHALTEEYVQLETPDLVAALRERCAGRAGRVVLNASADYVSRGSFIANRFLGSRLVKAGLVDLWPGKIAAIGRRRDESEVSVVLASGDVDRFDRVVLRHGTDPALNRFDPSLYRKCEPVSKRIAQIDRTCLPAWGERDFREILVSGSRRVGAVTASLSTADAIGSYLSVVADRAGGCPGADMQICLEDVAPGQPLLVVHDPWTSDAVSEWVDSIGVCAHEEPERLGLPGRHLPLILSAWRVLAYRTEEADVWSVVARTLAEIYGVGIQGNDLRIWRLHRDAQWLVVLKSSLLDGAELDSTLTWLMDGMNGSIRWIVVEPERAGSLAERRPELRVFKFELPETLSADENGLEDESDAPELLDRVLRGSGGDPTLDLAILATIADELVWAPRSPPSQAAIGERLVRDLALEQSDLEDSLTRFIASRVLSQRYLANPAQQHLAPDDPRLTIRDASLTVLLAGHHLANHPSELARRLAETPHHPRARVVAWAVRIVQSRSNELAGEIIAPLLTRAERVATRFRLELHAAGVALPADRVSSDLDELVNQWRWTTDELFLAGRLAKREPQIRDRLASLAEMKSETDVSFPRMLHAMRALSRGGERGEARTLAGRLARNIKVPGWVRIEAAMLAGALGDGEAGDILRAIAFSHDEDIKTRNRAARALKSRHDLEGASRALWMLLRESPPGSVRHDSLEMLVQMGALRDSSAELGEYLRQVAAASPNQDPPSERCWAANKLEELGVVDGLGEIWISISTDDSLEPLARITAAKQAFSSLESRHQALDLLAGYVCRSDLIAADRVAAAQALWDVVQPSPLPAAVSTALTSIVADDEYPGEVRAAAARLRASADPLADAGVELLRLGYGSSGPLRLACAKELQALGRESYARRILLSQVRDDAETDEIRDSALWELGFLRQFDDIAAACELGEIRGRSIETALMVLGELGANQEMLATVRGRRTP